MVIDECCKLLTPNNIKRIAKEVMKIAESYEDKTEVNRLEKELKEAKDEKDNQMKTLRVCKDDTVREMILEDLGGIGAKIKNLEIQIELEKTRRENISEKEIIKSLTKLLKGDKNDVEYRKTLIRLLINKIFLYDDKFTVTVNLGEDEVEITRELLGDIEKATKADKICLSTQMGHHKSAIQTSITSKAALR
jgi:hypothetical protein